MFQNRFHILSQYGAVVVWYMMGYMTVLCMAVQSLVVFLVATVFRSALAVWAVSAGLLVLINTQRFIQYLVRVAPPGTVSLRLCLTMCVSKFPLSRQI